MAAFDRMETSRLVMRRWIDDDRAPFAAMNADPEVMRYFPTSLDRAESDALVDRIEEQFHSYGFGLWALERRSDAAFLGFTGLSPVHDDLPYSGEVEVGWRLARAAWGQGYASEAAREALRVGFTGVRLERIVSLTAAINTPSRRVMQRIGMHRDPTDDFEHPALPNASPLRRHVLYRLSRSEWTSASGDRPGPVAFRR